MTRRHPAKEHCHATAIGKMQPDTQSIEIPMGTEKPPE